MSDPCGNDCMKLVRHSLKFFQRIVEEFVQMSGNGNMYKQHFMVRGKLVARLRAQKLKQKQVIEKT